MSTAWAFAYGSLVEAESASETLGRPVDPLPATLHGWRRGWTLGRDNARAEKRFEGADGERIDWCLALDLQPAEGDDEAEVNGALLELGPGEVDRLDRRELRYDRVEVRDRVSLADGRRPDRPVYAWTAKPANLFPDPPAGAVILASYLAAVESAFEALGPGELERFRLTTPEPPCEVVEARLAPGDRIATGNPRRW